MGEFHSEKFPGFTRLFPRAINHRDGSHLTLGLYEKVNKQTRR